MSHIAFDQAMENTLKVITIDELKVLKEQSRSLIFAMVRDRLMQPRPWPLAPGPWPLAPGPWPSVTELDGLRELATETMLCPALGMVAK